jgi:hypothetical protein
MICSRLSLTSVAERIGYGSVFAFSKAFKQAEGVSPRQFVRSFRRCKRNARGLAAPFLSCGSIRIPSFLSATTSPSVTITFLSQSNHIP